MCGCGCACVGVSPDNAVAPFDPSWLKFDMEDHIHLGKINLNLCAENLHPRGQGALKTRSLCPYSPNGVFLRKLNNPKVCVGRSG